MITAQNSSSVWKNPGCGPDTRTESSSRKMPPGTSSPSVSNRYVVRIAPRSRRTTRPLASERLNGRPDSTVVNRKIEPSTRVALTSRMTALPQIVMKRPLAVFVSLSVYS